MNALVNNRYDLRELLGKGAFGEVFHSLDTKTKQIVATKTEDVFSRYPQLHNEAAILKIMGQDKGFAKFHWFGNDDYRRYLVQERLGLSLQRLLENNALPGLGMSASIIYQLISRIWRLHAQSLVHRDIKPDNIMTGCKSKQNIFYLIDFGLAKLYRSRRNKLHIPLKQGKKLTGTARFASVYSHIGIETSRRDDMVSLVFVMALLIKGKLPWQGVDGESKEERYDKIKAIKQEYVPAKLFAEQPIELAQFYEHILSLDFQQRPDYHYLRQLLKRMAYNWSFKISYKFSWTQISSPANSSTSNSALLAIPIFQLLRLNTHGGSQFDSLRPLLSIGSVNNAENISSVFFNHDTDRKETTPLDLSPLAREVWLSQEDATIIGAGPKVSSRMLWMLANRKNEMQKNQEQDGKESWQHLSLQSLEQKEDKTNVSESAMSNCTIM